MEMICAAEVKHRAKQYGADLCGIASIDRFSESPAETHPAHVLAGCQSVIVIAVQFPASVLASPSPAAYTFVRNRLVDKTDSITFQLALEFERQNSRAIPVPSSDPYDYFDEKRRHGQGIISLKHAAVRAGLGQMGKNTLLVNPQFGNMLWLGGVLVDAKLEADPIDETQFCPPDCRLCLDACPAQALNGTTIDQKKCRSVSASYTEGGGGVYTCKLCRTLCPNCQR